MIEGIISRTADLDRLAFDHDRVLSELKPLITDLQLEFQRILRSYGNEAPLPPPPKSRRKRSDA